MSGSALALAPWDEPCPQLQALAQLVSKELEKVSAPRKLNRLQQVRFDRALVSMCAAIAIVATARVSDGSGYPISYANGDYARGPISVEHLRQIREGMLRAGLVRLVPGFHDRTGGGSGRASRLHPLPDFVRLVADAGVSADLLRKDRTDLIIMRGGLPAAVEPDAVRVSRSTLEALNRANAAAVLKLPDDAWERIASRYSAEQADPELATEFRGISEANVSLRRVFNGSWDCGGRLYGGFWQNIPKAERRLITINGAPTVELDYRALHPRVLYALKGCEPDGDPYTLEGFEVPRQMGKRTFNRLLNGTWKPGKVQNPLKFDREDRSFFADRDAFRAYIAAFRQKHELIADCFGKGMGVYLQRVDSDVALEVISEFASLERPIFPIHDSFIVSEDMEGELRSAMSSASRKVLGISVPVSG